MHWFLTLFFLSGIALQASAASPTETNQPPVSPSEGLLFKYDEPAEPQVAPLHQAWLNEHDSSKRQASANELMEAVIRCEKVPLDIAAEVERGGLPQNELKAPAAAVVTLMPRATLAGAAPGANEYPPSPVFRRMTTDRLEAWTSRGGWLFDAQGNLVANVQVPRKDGTGREWFGAFLPNGNWITTDIWSDDQQLNAYSKTGKWLWELPGSRIVARVPKLKDPDTAETIRPSIGWARSDKTGRRWLVSVGTDFARGYALIDPEKGIQPLPEDVDLWTRVYPRAMGPHGTYTGSYCESDDGKATLHRSEAAHGVSCGWPRYRYNDSESEIVLGMGNGHFGFWPGSHDIYLETDEDEPAGADDSRRWHRLWFFDETGKYLGEFPGSYLGDAADGKGLLAEDVDGQVAKIVKGKDGLTIESLRSFHDADGKAVKPLALYEGLGLVFFPRGADVALAKW